MNVATMKAAQQGAVLVGPDLAESLRARSNLPITFDYATSDWAPLGPIATTDRALRELLPASSPSLLAILPPERWAIRDYLIATRTFVFYEPQGVLATPAETAATMRVLRATPRGIPILGWFESPTLTEENSFVQMASAEGKFIVGVQELPNLSVLTAFGRADTHRQVPVSGSIPNLEDNKTYVVLAVPDGDNVDFVSGRMRELWSEPERGNRTMPLAWSINPLLADLAPPLLDWYYDTATPFDRFIAAPSGAGYLYPDYTGPGDLPAYLSLTDRYMAAADLDVVWLLNAFTASEIPYSDETLSAYVGGVHPVGIVLDYDDQPRTRDAWVAAGGGNASPVIRSTHFWTTEDNFFGKLDAALAASSNGGSRLRSEGTWRLSRRRRSSRSSAMSSSAKRALGSKPSRRIRSLRPCSRHLWIPPPRRLPMHGPPCRAAMRIVRPETHTLHSRPSAESARARRFSCPCSSSLRQEHSRPSPRGHRRRGPPHASRLTSAR